MGNSNDEREEFIIESIRVLCRINELNKIFGNNDIKRFLDDANVRVLAISVKGENDVEIVLDPSNQNSDSVQSGLYFIKTGTDTLTEKNIHLEVLVTPISKTPVNALFHTIHNLYAPRLLSASQSVSNFDRSLQKLLSKLDTGLESAVRSNDIGSIITPLDEVRFWEEQASGGDRTERKRAETFCQILGAIRDSFSGIENMSITELHDCIGEIQDTLDELWKAEVGGEFYEQNRMIRLIQVIGNAFIGRTSVILGKTNIWQSPYGQVRSSLDEALKLSEKWSHTVSELTKVLWKSYPDHKWKDTQDDDTPEQDSLVDLFRKRLQDILRIRTTNEELSRLLSRDEQNELSIDKTFDAFENINPMYCNSYNQVPWDRALRHYEKSLVPIEKSVATKLSTRIKVIFKEKSSNAQTILAEFLRYKNLLARPSMRKLLSDYRENLLSHVSAFIDQLDSDFSQRSSDAAAAAAQSTAAIKNGKSGFSKSVLPQSRNVSPTVSAIIWGKQLLATLEAIFSAVSELFEDLPSYRKFEHATQNLQNRVETWISDVFRDWTNDMEDLLADGALNVELSGQLMEIDFEGVLQVNFSERLVTLLREVRQLQELGLHVRSSLKKVATEAEQYYRYGVMLKKTANFFNTMDTQIIESQKYMLLDGLAEFEKVATNPVSSRGDGDGGKTVTWGNPTECGDYVERLRVAADKLSSENRKLQKIHEQLQQLVLGLMDIDLLRQNDRWKQQWNKISSLITQVETTYDPKRLIQWKQHWDHQIYKSLEMSYTSGLESLNSNLGEIKTELVYSSQKLGFRPTLEDLRVTYYKKMKKFIAIPASFRGLSGGKVARSLYGNLADRNPSSMIEVYSKAENLFERLSELAVSMEPYVILGCIVDMDAMVDATCLECSDWETNFKSIKSKRRELEKIQDYYKIDCIAVGTSNFKMTVEDQLGRLSDALVLSLRRNVLETLRSIDAFLTASLETLSKRPSSIQEISEATDAWNRISHEKNDWQKKADGVESKRKLLLSVVSSMSRDVAIDITETIEIHGRLPSRWENFQIALVAFNDMVEDQREQLKARVEDEIEAANQKVAQFVSRWNSLKPGREGVSSWDDSAVGSIFGELEDWKIQFDEVIEIVKTCVSNCEHFELAAPNFELMNAVTQDFESTQKEWGQFKLFNEQLGQLKKRDWISFRLNLFDAEDLARHWIDSMKGTAKGIVLDRIAWVCDGIRKAIPALKFMRGEPFKEEHWSILFRKLGMPKSTSLQNLTFGHFVDVIDTVADNLAFAKDMTSRAQGEVTIREAITELKSWSETAMVEMVDHEEMGRVTPLIKNWKDILTELGDSQSLLASLKESQYFRPFEQQASVYEKNMASLNSYLSMMNQIQRKWLYLEPIFGRGALPAEQARFTRIDEDWVDIMGKLAREPLLFNLCDESIFPRMSAILEGMVDQLDRCQKALADFLEDKRSKLPRFYFIGDDDLLEILGQATNPSVIQSHLKKLFQGIHSVVFSEDHSRIKAICSSDGEQVPLVSPVKVSNKVEVWLQQLSDEMRNTLKTMVEKCVRDNNSDLEQYPSQVLCLAENIRFTSRCEQAIEQNKISSLKKGLRKTLQAYTDADLTSQPLSQLKVKALILDLVHNIDVCEQLERHNVTTLEDWVWDKQLRYYLQNDGLCVCRMCNAEMKYTYEYWGNAAKLVHTPLTDKCYLTLTQGMHMGFGGSPYGPAGTGKTESVKALGGCLGRQVLVFNCDEGIDFQSMGRIFTGLVKCGAWGCFDEFNRLKEDQLSAVSQQIQIIQAAIKEKRPVVKLLGHNVNVDFNAGIFVTMNPAGKGYGGRSKLPDNLKQLFRPVAMSRPDNNLIAEVILYSEGFQNAQDLGRKLVSLYSLCRELLSSQQHYDWGLRAMKAVLNTGGKLVLAHKRQNGSLSSQHERELLIKALRVNTLSKLTYVDSHAFLGLIGDIFPGVESKDVEEKALEDAICAVMKEAPFKLEFNQAQLRKMMQLKESLDQRIGCVIVGPSGCGKSVLWNVLKAAMKRVGTTVKTYVMNPKSMPRERLLGHMDNDTREWFDGVLTNAAREVVKEPANVKSWIVCDGDVDPEWIESLNSVLDDNRLLTMPNGERISFGSNVNFIFETHDLRFASPATISRMGMIFLSDEDVEVKRLIGRWLHRKDKPENSKGEKEAKSDDFDLCPQLPEWIESYFYEALNWVLKRSNFVVETTMVGTVLNGLSHLENVLTKADFVIGLISGLGGNLDMETRKDFAKYCFDLTQEAPVSFKDPLDCFADRGIFAPYVPKSALEGDFTQLGNSGAIIQTSSVQRNLALIKPWVEHMEPFILVGPEGCGKTMLLKHCFRTVCKSVSVATLYCNAQTTASHVIQKIHQSCSLFSSNTGRVYRPRDAERLVLYLKDINLPKPDKYDTCMLIAFLQQLITCKGFYDENLEFLGIERIHIVASMNPSTTVGRHILSSRFTAVVRIAFVDYCSADELVGVYSTIFETALVDGHSSESSRYRLEVSDPKWRNTSNLRKLAESMIDIFVQVRDKFSVDDHRHYLFTPRDLTEWVLGLLRYDTSDVNLLDVFIYEAQRTFRDRLVDQESRQKFDSLLMSVMRKDWQHRPDSLNNTCFTSLVANTTSLPSYLNSESKETDEEKGKNGGDCSMQLAQISVDDLKALIENGKMMYEREENELTIELCNEVLEHFSQVDRVFSKPGGSILLIGRSGVGRRTTCMLLAHMHAMRFFTPTIVHLKDNDANFKAFFAQLKGVVQSAGIDGVDTVLYVEDHQIFSDQVLETINSLLCSGEVPGLYKHEELVPLLDPLKELMQEDISGSAKTPLEFFLQRVQKYLHVVVAMDPTHPKFLMRCESNPALYTKCSILWFGVWAHSTLTELPQLLYPQYFGDDAPDGWQVGSLRKAMVAIHNDNAITRGASPRDFIAFLECFKKLYESKAQAIEQKVNKFLGGLSKLEQASDTVDSLSDAAENQRKELKQKQLIADKSMDEITDALQLASKTKQETARLAEELKAAEEETLARKAKIEDELSEIRPILESAKEAVGGIKSEHLTELKSMKMPPDPVADVLSAVLMLLGIEDTSWLSMKKFLGNRGVKEDIMNYDTHRITADLRAKIVKILNNKKASFEKETIQRCSVAAAPFAAWVKANIRYSLVLEKIQPLEAELEEAVLSLESARRRMDECETELAAIDERVKELQENFKRATRDAETLNIALQDTEQTLSKAQHLLGQLGGEQQRWSLQAKQLRQLMESLPMRILLSSAFVTYLGIAPEDVRMSAVKRWATEYCGDGGHGEGKFSEDSSGGSLDNFDFKNIMSSESEMLVWKCQEGLSGDGLSMENAIIILNSPESRCPFVIDPVTTATAWLKQHLGRDQAHPLEVVAQQDSRFMNHVELAVRFGKTLLAVEVDTVEPILFPLIRRDLKRQGARWLVQIGDKQIDYNENFRLILSTRNPVPALSPDAASLVNTVNFTVTRSGLESQLLAVTVHHEQPELEEQKSRILTQEENFKVQLADLERELLDKLSDSEGNLLENQALLDTLSSVKEKSAEVSTALESSAEVSNQLDRERNQYRQVAESGSQLYFAMRELVNVKPMYQFSLNSFIHLFKHTLSDQTATGDIQSRMKSLVLALEKRIYFYVGRALFKADRLMFAMHLVHIIRPELFRDGEWEFLTGESVNVDDDDEGGNTEGKEQTSALLPSWAAADRGSALDDLQRSFPSLVSKLELHGKNSSQWSRWGKHPECESAFPSGLGLTLFQQLLVTCVLRPDRLQAAMTQFCCDALNIESLAPQSTTIASLMESDDKVDNTIPMLLIATPGSDPSKELEEYATRTIGRDKYVELALGGGQTDDALTILRDAARNGEWLCLKNLHLVTAWLPRLEKEFNSLTSLHQDFRLWLTTEETTEFTPILLQQSLKATFEAPPGIKKNLQRTYDGWDEQIIERGGTLQAYLLFCLAWFHALVQERRTYIPQGWTKFYEFSLGDLKSGLGVVQLAVETATTMKNGGDQKSSPLDWAYIHGLVENSVYGGRVDNPFDLRVLRAYLTQYFNDEVLKGSYSIDGITFPHQSTRKQDFLTWIHRLVDQDSPSIFGLPPNVERSVQRTLSEQTISSLKALATAKSDAAAFDMEAWRRKLLPFLRVWEKITQNADCFTKPSSQSADANDPIAMFLSLEAERAYFMITKIDKAVKNLSRVVKGTALLTPQIQNHGASLMRGEIPMDWRDDWEGCKGQNDWIRGVVSRKLQLKNWIKDCATNSLFDNACDLSELFNPATFLNALRQTTSRKLKHPMDALKLVSAWNRSELSDAKVILPLTGFYIQGATFDGNQLVAPDADAQELVKAPECYIAFIPDEKANALRERRKGVSLPLYQDLNRENLLMELDVPVRHRADADKWILGGVAFFLS